MAGLAGYRNPHVHAAFPAHGKPVVHPARFKIKRRQAAFRLLGQQHIGLGTYMGGFLVPDKNQLEGMLSIPQLVQHLGQVNGHDDAALHIIDPGAIGLSVPDGKGIFRIAAVGKYCVQVAAKQNRFARPLLAQVRPQKRNGAARGQQFTGKAFPV